MAMPTKLRVLARGGILVCDHAALDAGARRFIGRHYDASLGDAGGWAHDSDPVEIPSGGPHGREYVLAIKDGHLWPADQATATACNVPFDSNYGGEFAAVKE